MRRLIFLLFIVVWQLPCRAAALDPIVAHKFVPGSFAIANNGKVAPILVSENEWIGVIRAAKNLQTDLQKVTGVKPDFLTDKVNQMPIIIGTIGQSKVIDALVSANKINVGGIIGKWESTLIEVVKNPLPGIDSALVIAGSDKRGTIYGVYELSYQLGVSPWYYWADVPVKTSKSLFAIAGRHVISSPAVKYRGIFLNDEAPALSGWSRKEFGGFNHQFYEKVFELILRLKGNYLWPAMWGSAFNDDDKMNPILADEYGVVVGTSHHEPLTRAHDEWKRFKGGKWNYEQNPEQLREFWESGLKRVADKEQIITVGMRGDGDEPMTEGTATALLERIVKDQRAIIEKVTNKPADQTPQLWALYKEVQAYYDNGMRVPDDITLLLADDNWGNIRKLPKLEEAPRSGGYGIYYHFDYVGDPRNYKWINTNPIQKVWEQMHLANAYNANQIWIVNVGDLKPMEFPLEFFLDYAWAPDAIPAEQLQNYTVNWAAKQFGDQYAAEIAKMITAYLKYNGRIKPELLNETTYSLVNYDEFKNVVDDFKSLEKQAKFIYDQIPSNQKDAYYQLVLHPIEANANLHQLYFAVAKNKLYAKQGRILTNELINVVDSLYQRDAAITNFYNKVMAGGKWDHMMDQTHIGYTYWQQPEENSIPKTIKISNGKPQLGLAVESTEQSWIKTASVQAFPVFSTASPKTHYFELFNTGLGSISYEIKAEDFVLIRTKKGQIKDEQRFDVTIDWAKVPKGKTTSTILIVGNDGSKFNLQFKLQPTKITSPSSPVFVAEDGVIAMEAPNYSRAINKRPIFWKTIPSYGKTLGGVIATPVTAPTQQLDAFTPHLAYDIFVDTTGTFTLHSFISPTIDFTNTDGLKFAVAVDDNAPIIVNISAAYKSENAWRQSVADGIKIFKTNLNFSQPGKHTIKYYMVTPGVVLQKLVLDLGGLKPSFLGPPESKIIQVNK